MKQNVVETLVGFLVIITALVFFIFAYNKNNFSEVDDGYMVSANFENAEGVTNGTDVMLAGIKIGVVEKMTLDPSNFLAVISLKIDKHIKLPKDSRAAITSSGLLGGKFIAISPGSSEEFLAERSQIKYTQSSINIEALVGKLLYGK